MYERKTPVIRELLAARPRACHSRAVQAKQRLSGSLTTLSLTALATVSALSLVACDDQGAPSNLAKRGDAAGVDGADKQPAAPSESPKPADGKQAATTSKAPSSADAKQPDAPATDASAPSTPAPADGSVALVGNPTEGERVQLKLRLKQDSIYRVMTIGNVQLPAVQKPTGFARQEELKLTNCAGEGLDRSCTLEHRYLNYDAEPPTGTFMKQDELQVSELVTSHTLFADGRYGGPTKVEGPAERVSAPAGQALTAAERFYCLRLPKEPVAERASWKSRCRRRVGGKVDEREVVYVLKTLGEEPGTGEKRAEIAYIGSYTTTDPKLGERKGAVTGSIFLWVSTGELHMIREKISLTMDDGRGLSTQTTMKTQLSRLDPGPPEVLTRTDERPFSTPPVTLNKAAGHEYKGPKYKVAGVGDATTAGDAKKP